MSRQFDNDFDEAFFGAPKPAIFRLAESLFSGFNSLDQMATDNQVEEALIYAWRGILYRVSGKEMASELVPGLAFPFVALLNAVLLIIGSALLVTLALVKLTLFPILALASFLKGVIEDGFSKGISNVGKFFKSQFQSIYENLIGLTPAFGFIIYR